MDDEKIMNEMIDCGKEILTDVLDADLNLFIDNEFIKDIPIVGSLYKGYNLAKTIENAIFMRKLCIFIANLPNVTQEEKEKFWKNYKKDERKFAIRLFEIINHIDDSEKCKYEAKLFEKYFYNHINYEEFKKYSYALCRIDLLDLKEGYKVLKNAAEKDDDGNILIERKIGASFLSTGMAEIVTFPGTCGFCFNKRGIDFLERIFHN